MTNRARLTGPTRHILFNVDHQNFIMMAWSVRKAVCWRSSSTTDTAMFGICHALKNKPFSRYLCLLSMVIA